MASKSEDKDEAPYPQPNTILDDDTVARKILSEIVETRSGERRSDDICLKMDNTDPSSGANASKVLPPSSTMTVSRRPQLVGSISPTTTLNNHTEHPKSPKMDSYFARSSPKKAGSHALTLNGLEYCEDLAVATAVYDYSSERPEDAYLPTCVEYDPDAKAAPYGRSFLRRFRCPLLAAGLLIMGVIVFVCVAVLRSKDMKPTEWMRAEAETLLGMDMEVQEEPYRKALEWMMNHDPTSKGLSKNDSGFIQRFVLTYFYFATSIDQEWAYCAPPKVNDKPTCTFFYSTKHSGEMEEETKSVDGYRWLSEVHECDWVGVTCNSDGQIERIILDGLEQTGTFPNGIQYLTSLQYLRLTDSGFYGPLPKDLFGRMSSLTHLYLRLNLFTGTIPMEWFTTTHVSSLIHLDLSQNKLSGSIASDMGLLNHLEYLVLTNNELNGTIPEEVLGGMTKLSDVSLSGNRLTGTIPTSIAQLSNIVQLNLDRNHLQGTIPDMIGMLGETLVSLNLANNGFYGELPTSIYKLKQLVLLDVSGCRFNGTLMKNIGRSFPSMTELYVNNNQFSGSLPQQLNSMKNLIGLKFSDNKLTGSIPTGLCRFVSESCCKACCAVDGSACPPDKNSTNLP